MPTRADVIDALTEIAPLALAEKWDNVGLLVGPPFPPDVTDVMLTIDLTEAVLDEALAADAQLIVAYHPPIFKGLKALTMRHPDQRVVVRALAEQVSVYSPHTALDAARGGLCDWLLEPFGDLEGTRPITPARVAPGGLTHGLALPADAAEHAAVQKILVGLTPLGGVFAGSRGAVEWAAGALADVGITAAIQRFADVARADAGAGRRARLAKPLPLTEIVHLLKRHLDLPYLRVAAAEAHLEGAAIERVAVCPGAGGSLFEGVRGVDLLVTGEMRHHDILAHRARGTSVILSDHTNTERGYLPRLATRLKAMVDVEVHCSAVDADPLIVA